MLDELLTLYNQDEDFKRYVDAYRQKHDLTLQEAISHYVLREYGKWLKEQKK